jgi:hypothetical protein
MGIPSLSISYEVLWTQPLLGSRPYLRYISPAGDRSSSGLGGYGSSPRQGSDETVRKKGGINLFCQVPLVEAEAVTLQPWQPW